MCLGLHKIHLKPHSGLAGCQHRRGPRPRPVAERLWARTDKTSSPNGCWLVSGHALPNGYVKFNRKADGLPEIFAHRLAWELTHGPIPPGLEILHACDTPRCVNPSHLSVGTHRANILDSICKGRYNAFGIQKLNASQVREIRALARLGRRQKDIAAQFKIARNTVSGIVNRKTWAHLDPPVRGDVR